MDREKKALNAKKRGRRKFEKELFFCFFYMSEYTVLFVHLEKSDLLLNHLITLQLSMLPY